MKWPRFYKKKSASAFWKAKLIFIHEKKKQRSKYTSKSFETNKGQKSKNIALEILKLQCTFWIFSFKYEKYFFFLKRTRIFEIIIIFKWNPSNKRDKCHFSNTCGKLWQNSRPVCSTLKTDIEIQSQNWCLRLTILKLLKTQHCAL